MVFGRFLSVVGDFLLGKSWLGCMIGGIEGC